jgi:hypothetical protein
VGFIYSIRRKTFESDDLTALLNPAR